MSFFLLVPVWRWLQTKRITVYRSKLGLGYIVYEGTKATVLAVGYLISGFLTAILCGLILLDPTPNLALIMLMIVGIAFSLLGVELLRLFVSGTQYRK